MLNNYDTSINDYNLPLIESHYNPNNYLSYLKNEHYHHSEKGCIVEMVVNPKQDDGTVSINKICRTHDKRCSKTGWELGWYLGTKTKDLHIKTYCRRCGILIYTDIYNRFLYCPDCRKIKKEEIKEYTKNKMRLSRQQYAESKRFVQERSENIESQAPLLSREWSCGA